MTYSILHSVSQVLVLAGLLSVFSTTLIVWLKLRKHMRDAWKDYERTVSASGEKPDLPRIPTTLIKHWPAILVAVTGLSLGTNCWQLYHEFQRQTFVELRNIRVLDRKDEFLFQMDSEDPDTHQRHPFMIRFCPDYEPTHEMQHGVTLTLLKYERRDLDDCATISKRSLGYIIERSADGKPIIFDAR